MFKSILITAILLITISLTAQNKREISNFEACISDSVFTLSVYPIISKASEIIKTSNIPAKEALESLNALNSIIAYLDKQIEDAKKAEKVESDKPKSKAKSK